MRGEDALWMASATPYDVVCLDVNLPGIDGFETCRRLRARRGQHARAHAHRPRRGQRPDHGPGHRRRRLPGQSPSTSASCSPACAPLARRRAADGATVLAVGDLTLDPAATASGAVTSTSTCPSRRSRCSRSSCVAPGEVLSQLQVLEGAWDAGYENRSNVIAVYIRYLRQKIDPALRRRDARDRPWRGLPPSPCAALTRC